MEPFTGMPSTRVPLRPKSRWCQKPVFKINFGAQPASKFVPDDERVVAAAAERDGLAGNEIQDGGRAVPRLDGDSRSHTPESS